MISARTLDLWVEQNRPQLAAQGVSAWFGTTMRVGRQAGPTWVSFVSRTADARVIRRPDGSCEFDASRFADGAVLMHECRPTTTTEDLDSFVRILTNEPTTGAGASDGRRR